MSQEYQYVVRPIASSIIANSSWSLTSAISAAVKRSAASSHRARQNITVSRCTPNWMQFVGFLTRCHCQDQLCSFHLLLGLLPTADFSRISFWRSLNNIGTGLGPRMPVLCLRLFLPVKAHYKPSRYFRVVLDNYRKLPQAVLCFHTVTISQLLQSWLELLLLGDRPPFPTPNDQTSICNTITRERHIPFDNRRLSVGLGFLRGFEH